MLIVHPHFHSRRTGVTSHVEAVARDVHATPQWSGLGGASRAERTRRGSSRDGSAGGAPLLIVHPHFHPRRTGVTSHVEAVVRDVHATPPPSGFGEASRAERIRRGARLATPPRGALSC